MKITLEYDGTEEGLLASYGEFIERAKRIKKFKKILADPSTSWHGDWPLGIPGEPHSDDYKEGLLKGYEKASRDLYREQVMRGQTNSSGSYKNGREAELKRIYSLRVTRTKMADKSYGYILVSGESNIIAIEGQTNSMELKKRLMLLISESIDESTFPDIDSFIEMDDEIIHFSGENERYFQVTLTEVANP